MNDAKRQLLERLITAIAHDNLIGLNLAEYMEVIRDFTAYAYFSVLRDCNRLDLLDESAIAEEIKALIAGYKRGDNETPTTKAA